MAAARMFHFKHLAPREIARGAVSGSCRTAAFWEDHDAPPAGFALPAEFVDE